jgi:hypothetical protein
VEKIVKDIIFVFVKVVSNFLNYLKNNIKKILTVDVAERLFDGSSWGEVSERKLQAGFIKKIDGKKNLISRDITTARPKGKEVGKNSSEFFLMIQIFSFKNF